MRDRLTLALAPLVGQILTAEAAKDILRQFPADDDQRIDLGLFPPVRRGSMVFQAERIVSAVKELDELHQLHAAEDPAYRDEFGERLNYPELMLEERRGTLVQITARVDGALVGQFRILLRRELHTGQRFAREESLFLKPECRRGRAALRLLTYPREGLRAMGYRRFQAKVRTENLTMRKLLRATGFRLMPHNEYMLNEENEDGRS
jgi:hypothetical protein